MAPVSYTHLDVYKRQDFDCSGVLEGLCSMENAGAELFDMVEEVCNLSLIHI